MKISATIITLNEEKNIRDCITSVQNFCDEVIVLDSESTDATREIATEMGATVIVQPYLGDGPQKACAASHASHDWVLSLDADERVDAEMAKAIAAVDLDNAVADHFAFNRKTFIGDEWNRVWYPDFCVRLYNRKTAEYEKKMGHAKVIGDSPAKLAGHILHYSFDDYEHLARVTIKFANRGANMFVEKNKKIGPLSPITHAVTAFLRKYLGKKGIFYGESGLTVSLTTAYGTYLKYALARKRKRS